MSEDYRIRVRIDAQIEFMKPPASSEQRMHRDQANIRIQDIARRFENAIEHVLEDVTQIYDPTFQGRG